MCSYPSSPHAGFNKPPSSVPRFPRDFSLSQRFRFFQVIASLPRALHLCIVAGHGRYGLLV